MLKVSGCLSDLFLMKHTVYILDWKNICNTLVNQPITDENHNPIGIITEVNVDDDTWKGYLMKTDFVETTLDHKKCISIVVK